ncbi:MAG: FHA domain-containing protein [Alphaproteobacteria bacterium]|nr:FHA domain-containing protein [Alphaproteobacteria bacterium]
MFRTKRKKDKSNEDTTRAMPVGGGESSNLGGTAPFGGPLSTDDQGKYGTAAEPEVGATDHDAAGDARSGRARAGGRPAGTVVAPGMLTGEDEENDAMNDPPSGWLVVVRGPGKGNVLTLGLGQNHIGSAPGQRVRIDFGDPRISSAHAIIVYDPRSRKFTLQPGSGKGLVYLQATKSTVLVPTEIRAGAVIELGDTALRFVPLCGPGFCWSAGK